MKYAGRGDRETHIIMGGRSNAQHQGGRKKEQKKGGAAKCTRNWVTKKHTRTENRRRKVGEETHPGGCRNVQR